jgi:hypothetical protein
MYIAQTDKWYLEGKTVLIAGIINPTTAIFAWISGPRRLILTFISGLNEAMLQLWVFA